MSVKTKIATKTIKDPDIIEMFNKMLGAGDPDPNIVIPKYDNIIKAMNSFINMLSHFVNSPFASTFINDFNKAFNEIKIFIEKSKKQLKELELEKNDGILSGEDLNQINSNPEKIKELFGAIDYKYKITGLKDKYYTLKNCELTKDIVLTLKTLKNLLILEKNRSKIEIHNLENKENLSLDFIINSDGDFLTIFNFSTLDFKQIMFNELMNEDYKKYISLVLHLTLKKCETVVKEITSPDIDVDKFSVLLVNNIQEIKKHIPRCDDAFKKIEQSVDLLKNNFGEYYKDFISSQNPGIIIEHFVLDVAKSSKAETAVMHQFTTIVKYYRDNMQARVKDPKVKKMFELISANMQYLNENNETKTSTDKNETD